MAIQPILLADTDAPYITEVFCVDHQLAPGDIVYSAGESCYELLRREVLEWHSWGKPARVRDLRRWDYGGLQEVESPVSHVIRFTVVGGSKVVRANTEAGAVYKVWAGWMWRENR